MTPETYQRVKAHVEANSTPPCDLFPDGLGLPLVVSWEREPDDPLLEPGRITMCMADYADLMRHIEADPSLRKILPTVRGS